MSKSFDYLIENNKDLQKLSKDLKTYSVLSQTGITNFIVKYEDEIFVNALLQYTFDETKCLNNNIFGFDAVELQQERPGAGNAYKTIDALIFGQIILDDNSDPVLNPLTGEPKRIKNGLVNSDKKYILIKNIDNSVDFCPKGSEVSKSNFSMFNKIKNSKIRNGKSIILITNEEISLPFPIQKIEIEKVNNISAQHILESYKKLFSKKYQIETSPGTEEKITKKIIGYTYTEACDLIINSIIDSRDGKNINLDSCSINLRKHINKKNLLQGTGLTQITAKPWGDYICPESNNFSYDVKKILRDFEEIKTLKEKDENDSFINVIQNRMPHVIMLYGPGGTGKSAFPVHLAGLLDFDIWDFNIGASHSMWVGKGREQIANTLSLIEKSNDLIIRIDEYDRMAGSTSNNSEGMHGAHKQVEGELMNWLQKVNEEGILLKNNIFIILTTNHKDNITGPLKRTGRIDLVIDLERFDIDSIVKTFLTSYDRIKNKTHLMIEKEIFFQKLKGLNLKKISELASKKGFSVKDIDTMLIEMIIHDYYFQKQKSNIEWNQGNFEKIIELSTGSLTSNNETREFIFGDRFFNNEDKIVTNNKPPLKLPKVYKKNK